MDKKAPDRFLGLVGLAKRAGRTVTGAPLIFTAMRTKRPPCLVLVAEDASDGARKKLRTKCEFYKIPLLYTTYSKDALAHAVGNSGEVAAVAITDQGLAGELLKPSMGQAKPDGGNEEM